MRKGNRIKVREDVEIMWLQECIASHGDTQLNHFRGFQLLLFKLNLPYGIFVLHFKE